MVAAVAVVAATPAWPNIDDRFWQWPAHAVITTPSPSLSSCALDAAGNPVAGKPVTWTESGGISFASPTIQTTDANGQAEMMWVPGGRFSPACPTLLHGRR